ncbi:helix-turn-helix domain-containing protein [Agrococcus beijingensis]|uniref:arsenate reductase/protein-tyrosine-phosphatase family protein n=1 Tax=Agrococcus beijingensis TaxID=3068634 RepID=UPI0027427F1C|nr:helix-turn-helix domain-containing protein [Agrococcus sp. REN33]
MNTEQTGLGARAAKHAALADRARLRLVDLLTLGDLAPSEIADSLGMPSNLVAHHLSVLERAGLVTRTRSEADRRRSYVRLAPAGLAGLAPSPTAAARRVVFVCTANSARSQLAVELWARRSDIPATSAGTRPAAEVAPGAVAVAARRGLDLQGAVPRGLDGVVEPTDLVITVCDAAHESFEGAALHWSVPDPVRVGTDAAFDAAFDDLERRIDELATRLRAA